MKTSLKSLQTQRPVLLFILLVSVFALLSGMASFLDYQISMSMGGIFYTRLLQIVLNIAIIAFCYLFVKKQSSDYCMQKKSRLWYLELILLLPLLVFCYLIYLSSSEFSEKYYLISPLFEVLLRLIFLFSTIFALIALTVLGVYLIRDKMSDRRIRFAPMLAAPLFYIILLLSGFFFGLFDVWYGTDVFYTFSALNQISFSTAFIASAGLSFFGLMLYYRYHNFTRTFFASVLVVGVEFYYFLSRDQDEQLAYLISLFVLLLPFLFFAFFQFIKKADENVNLSDGGGEEHPKACVESELKKVGSLNSIGICFLFVCVFSVFSVIMTALDALFLEEYTLKPAYIMFPHSVQSYGNAFMPQIFRTVFNAFMIVFCRIIIKKQNTTFHYQKKKRKIWLDILMFIPFLSLLTIRLSPLEADITSDEALLVCLSGMFASVSSILAAVHIALMTIYSAKEANKGFKARIFLPVMAVSVFYMIYSIGVGLVGEGDPMNALPRITTLSFPSMVIMPFIISFVCVVLYYCYHDYIKVYMIAFFMTCVESIGYCATVIGGEGYFDPSRVMYSLLPAIPLLLIALFCFNKITKNKHLIDAPFEDNV